MSIIAIHLQEGFANDLVNVRVNGRERLRRENARTDMMLGYAEIEKVSVRAKQSEIVVELPRRALLGKVVLDTSADTEIGCSVVDGGLVLRIPDRPFGYA